MPFCSITNEQKDIEINNSIGSKRSNVAITILENWIVPWLFRILGAPILFLPTIDNIYITTKKHLFKSRQFYICKIIFAKTMTQ